jgi:hypothetical protein
MTREEFNKIGFSGDMMFRVTETDEVYNVVSVDFGESLVALDVFDDIEDPKWYRCESVELL